MFPCQTVVEDEAHQLGEIGQDGGGLDHVVGVDQGLVLGQDLRPAWCLHYEAGLFSSSMIVQL